VEHKLKLPSFAKVNLGLRVLGKRTDGFHDIFTVFQTVSLKDELQFEPSDTLSLSCTEEGIPTDSSNLVLMAAETIARATGSAKGARITLTKNIPSPGGLGGGSSNAAVTLLALNKLWETGLAIADLHSIAETLGSDVPFFLYGGTAIGEGRGTIIRQLDDLHQDNLIIVTPDEIVATSHAFEDLQRSSLTAADSERILLNCRLRAADGIYIHDLPPNDFENSVFLRFPQVAKAVEMLRDLEAVSVRMSGSGPSVLGFFDKTETRQTAMKALGEMTNWRSFAVAAISREEYREALEQVF
jgi:4-diphosphocytidyl-2-C-methyl-D-erythritol kinase